MPYVLPSANSGSAPGSVYRESLLNASPAREALPVVSPVFMEALPQPALSALRTHPWPCLQ